MTSDEPAANAGARHTVERIGSALIFPARAVLAWARGPQRTHRALIVASVALPLAVLAIGATLAWQAAVAAGHARLGRTIDVAHENAARVFETYKLLLKEADAAVAVLPDAEIASREREFHDRLAAMIDRLPQVKNLFILDAQGHPIVSAGNYPVQHELSAADRDYFQSSRSAAAGLIVGTLHLSRVDHATSFYVAAPRMGPNNEFRGSVVVAADPAYFENYWQRNGLADATPDGMTLVLFRSDGTFLVRWPQPIPAGNGAVASTSFHVQLANAPEAGSYQLRFPDDGIFRMLAYRHVEGLPLYVVASLRQSSITEAWLGTMSKHLYFGVPATLALLSLAIAATRRAQRESIALELLEAESRRREQVEEALRQSQKMEAIGRLTGGIAHDFNNLLMALGGSVEYLIKAAPQDDRRTRRYTAMAREAVQRATTLTHRLLAFARQQPLEAKTVNLNRLVTGISELLLRTLGEDIRIETVLAGGLWTTKSDANQLENTLLNLAINARDAMPQGGKLTIETGNAYLDDAYAALHTEVTPGQYVLLAVTDTGAGMPPEIVDRVFDPFFTTKPAGQGTGLGMSMVYGFVKQSGGHIKIYSEVGRGTTIKIYLPRSMAGPELATDQPTASAEAPCGRGEKILIVEDDDAVRELSIASLQELGYRAVAAHDAASALEVIRQHKDIDLLFTDVVLPGGMDGRALAEQARLLRPGLQVLFTTGYTPNAIIHNGVLDAGVHLLPKPFTTATLGAKLNAMLGAARSAVSPSGC